MRWPVQRFGRGGAWLVMASWVVAASACRRPAGDRPEARGERGAGARALVAPPGALVYERRCASCHGADGRGAARAYPPLAGSSWLTEDAATPIRIVLAGLEGPIDVGGARYDNVMPNLGIVLTDAEIADVVTYARASWGNLGTPVDASDVARVRAETRSQTRPRAVPWRASELEAARDASP